jgi:hypothetical protein
MKGAEEEPFDGDAAGGGRPVPAWMVVVYLTLLGWGGWYLVHFWRALAGPES